MNVKDKIASGLGSVLEWYDFSLYGFFAPLIARLYFPNQSANMALLKVFSVFAIGFFARPFGAIIFGSISDRCGRVASLKITPILITIPTLFLSLLPTYQQIGIFAPMLLVLMRIIQGFCIGGEYANNIVYLCEKSDSKYKYIMGSIGSCTASLGILTASFIAAIFYAAIPYDDLLSWGWRVAFSISLLIGIATYMMRKNMHETVIFRQLSNEDLISSRPIVDSFKYQRRDYVVSFGLTLLPATAFYYVFMFMPNFLAISLGYDSARILGDGSASLLARLLIIPIIGLVANKIGGIIIARLASILFFFFSYPLMLGIISCHVWSPVFIFSFAILTTLNAATTPGLLMTLLKPKTRCTIFSFTFNVCFGVFGGIVPIISAFLVEKTGSNMASVYYLMFVALITFITTFFFEEKIYRD